MTIKKLALTTALIAAGASTASAGALDRSIFRVAPLFEEGTYAEIGTALVLPTVSGNAGPATIENIYDNYTQTSLSYKTDIVPNKLALAINYYQPIGTDIQYGTVPGGALTNATASLNAQALSALLKYKFNNISVYGGGKIETVDANLSLAGGTVNYTGQRSSDIAPIAGIAYERPEIALRVSLTYIGATEYSLNTLGNTPLTGGATVPVASATLGNPDSYILDFQSGIAKDTLIFGSIRNKRWASANIVVPDLANLGQPTQLSDFNNITSFDLGIGRKLTDKFSVFSSLNYERQVDGITGNLAPIDGRQAITIGGSYKAGKAKLTGGIRYTRLGDVTTTSGTTFSDNSSLSIGMRVGYSF